MKLVPARAPLCFITDSDLGSQQVSGATVNDLRILRHLKKFGDVDVVFLQKDKYRTVYMYLPIYVLQVLRSLFKSYRIYFTRSIIASFMLTSLRLFGRSKIKVVHQAFSVPFTSSEIKFLRLNIVESALRFGLYSLFEKKALPSADAITIASEEYGKALIRIGTNPSKIHVLPFCVEDVFFKQPIKEDVRETLTFCYVGGFHLYHSLLPLLDAFELVCSPRKKVKLLLVGDGPQRPMLEREIERRKLMDNVSFLGRVPHSSLPSVLSKVDCVISLISKSGMSISLLEAAASGKAIIAYAQDETLNHYFKNGEDIYLLATLSSSEIANAMETIYANPKLRNTMAKGARAVAQQHFSEDVFSDQLHALMNQISGNDQPKTDLSTNVQQVRT